MAGKTSLESEIAFGKSDVHVSGVGYISSGAYCVKMKQECENGESLMERWFEN